MVENKYNEEPVHYCTMCNSLAIIRKEVNIASNGNILKTECYCKKCGSTHIEMTDIFTWLESNNLKSK
jgi:C4-type Zn-finger protein